MEKSCRTGSRIHPPGTPGGGAPGTRHPQFRVGQLMDSRGTADIGEVGNVKPWPQLVPRLHTVARRFRKVYSGFIVLAAWELGAIAINDPLFLPHPPDVAITLG